MGLSEEIAGYANQMGTQPTDPVAQHMKAMYQVLSRLAASVENIEEKCATKDDLKTALATTNKRVSENTESIEALKARVSKLENERETMLCGVNSEIDSRIDKQRKLVIFGIPESDGASGEERKKQDLNIATDLFKDMQLDSDEIIKSIRTLYRPGKRNDEKPHPRPIILSFTKPSKKYQVLRNAKNLKNQTKWKNVSLCNDKTKMQLHFEEVNDANAKDDVEQKNANLTLAETQRGVKYILKGPRGKKRAQKQVKTPLSEMFHENTMDETFHGFGNKTIIASSEDNIVG